MNKKKYLIIIIVTLLGIGGYLLYEKSKYQAQDLLIGLNDEVKNGQTVIFDYRGFLYDSKAPNGMGKEFDSTYRRHAPMRAVVGAKQVIPGLERGLLGMKAGGQRLVTLGPSMAYGETPAAGDAVPADSKVIYLIELRSIEN